MPYWTGNQCQCVVCVGEVFNGSVDTSVRTTQWFLCMVTMVLSQECSAGFASYSQK